MTLTMYQFQGFMAVIYGLTCLLMCYHVGKLEERIAKLEYELNKEYLDRVKTITKTIIKWMATLQATCTFIGFKKELRIELDWHTALGKRNYSLP